MREQMEDEFHLRRAIRLAMNGRGRVEPNPMVGCVLTRGGRVIGEGYHREYGQSHAEPDALANCTESVEGATAYVTLEPCCHRNKQTPPCVPRLIAAKVSRVVVGCLDPNPDVNGNGVRQLREAGIAVDGPRLEPVCRQLIAPYVARSAYHRPYITMKWAQTADGKIAGSGGKRLQISNPASSRQVQWLRTRSDAIVVGINTVLNDDPILLPREVRTVRKRYLRIVLDRQLRLPLDSQLVKSIARGPVMVCTRSSPSKSLLEAGVLVQPENAWLSDPALSHVLIEPGPTLARAMFGIADRLWVIRSPKMLDDPTAPPAADIPGFYMKAGEIDLEGDALDEYLNTQSPVFFTNGPSADFVLAGCATV
jgi:diaminohydroxyphosphoribosylaminopyrimidine deaminase/5-amino-6-(5-phosphoribosylamino)uracil reductase